MKNGVSADSSKFVACIGGLLSLLFIYASKDSQNLFLGFAFGFTLVSVAAYLDGGKYKDFSEMLMQRVLEYFLFLCVVSMVVILYNSPANRFKNIFYVFYLGIFALIIACMRFRKRPEKVLALGTLFVNSVSNYAFFICVFRCFKLATSFAKMGYKYYYIFT